MAHYDIAAKVLLEHYGPALLQHYLGYEVVGSDTVEELPQETTSVRRSDYPLLVTDRAGVQRLVVLEVQTHWAAEVPVRLLEYRCRHWLHLHDRGRELPVVTCVLLLRPSAAAAGRFRDDEVDYHFHLLKIYEEQAAAVLAQGEVWQLPFVPLMQGGVALTPLAEEQIVASALPRQDKADVLMAMSVLAHAVSESLARDLYTRRRDLMLDATVLEWFREDFIKEGEKRGLELGRQEGVKEGVQQGEVLATRNTLLLFLVGRFGDPALSLREPLQKIDDRTFLGLLVQRAATVASLDEFRQLLG